MQKNLMKLFGLNVGVIVAFSGCSLLNLVQKKINEGTIEGEAYQIEKITVENQTYKAPQILAKEAQERLQTTKPSPQEKNSTQASSDSELATIKGIATMIFNKTENRIFGSSGCGLYFASYSWENRRTLSITEGTQTRSICNPSEVMRFDFRFLRGLRGSFKVSQPRKGVLILENTDMTIYLIQDDSLNSQKEESVQP